MQIDFLVEEPSMEVFLAALLQRRQSGLQYAIHVFQGKRDLLRKLPSRLTAYSRWLGSAQRIVVIVDCDQDDCHVLKARLEDMALGAGLATRSHPRADGSFSVVDRIAVEELEAWYLGDPEALRAAFPRLPENLCSGARFRNPDAILGGTWEALERLLRQHGYYQGGLAKMDLARRVAPHIDWTRNRSRSFQSFRQALDELLREPEA